MRFRSKKKEKEYREYRKAVAEYLSGAVCEARELGNCFGPMTVHHVKKRSAGGKLNDPDNWLPMCAHHNGWVEDNPNEAHEMGLVKKSWED